MRKSLGMAVLLSGMMLASTASAQLRSSFFGGADASKITYTRVDNGRAVDLSKPTSQQPNTSGDSKFSFSRLMPTFKLPEMFGGKPANAPKTPTRTLPSSSANGPYQPIKPFQQPR